MYIRYNPNLKERARELRKNMTPAEKSVWYSTLRNFPLRVHRQKIIGNYIVDFYIADKKLVIEIDGDTHIIEKQIEYDKKRTEYLESEGCKVIRFWNNDIIEGYVDVKSLIYKECDLIPREE